MSESNSQRMFKLQEENDWDDEALGDLAIAFLFDSGKAPQFVEYLEKYAEESSE